MSGLIDTEYVLKHPASIIQCFGFVIYCKCLYSILSRSRQTFLSIVVKI